MPYYRAYPVASQPTEGPATYAGVPPFVIEADSDGAAIEAAKQLREGRDLELWEGARFVRAIKLDGG